MNKCTCNGPGFCERHNFVKTEYLFNVCKNNDVIRGIWDGESSGVQPNTLLKINPKPSFFSKITSLGTELIKFASSGLPIRSQEEQQKCLDICKECEFFDGSKCAKCGCYMNLKVKLQTANCPIGKW